MKEQQKWRPGEKTLVILKEMGIKSLSEENIDNVLDMLYGKIPNRTVENEDRASREELAEVDAYEDAIDDLNDHLDQGFDYEWINAKLAE